MIPGVVCMPTGDAQSPGGGLPVGAVGVLDFFNGVYLWGATEYTAAEVIDHPEYILPGLGLHVRGYDPDTFVNDPPCQLIGTDFFNYLIAMDWTIVVELISLDEIQPLTVWDGASQILQTVISQGSGGLIGMRDRPSLVRGIDDVNNFPDSTDEHLTVVYSRTNAHNAFLSSNADSIGSVFEDTTNSGANSGGDTAYIASGIGFTGPFTLIRRIVFYPPLANGELAALAVKTMPQPANDDFASAIALTVNVPVIGHNFLATEQTGEPDHGGITSPFSVWYKFTAPATDDFVVSVSDIGDFFGNGPAVGIYTGSAVNSLTEVADGTAYPRVTVPFSATSGTTYYIGVTGADDTLAQGPFTIAVQSSTIGAGAAAGVGAGAAVGEAMGSQGAGAAVGTGAASATSAATSAAAGTAAGTSTAAGARAWTPADMTTAAWYDASDSNNVTLTGADVDQWDDLSGNGNHLTQATASNKPDYDTATNLIDGKNVISFDGSNDFLAKSSVSGFPTNNSSYVTMVGVFRARNVSTRSYFDFVPVATTNTTALMLSDGASMHLRCGGSGSQASRAFTDSINPHVWSATFKRDNRQIRLGGETASTNTTALTEHAYTNMRIGLLFSGTFAMLGDFAELVFFSGDDTANRQKLEGYLAHKWGLESNLVAGHPYKSVPP